MSKKTKELVFYSKVEELINIYTHGIGFLFSIVGGVLLFMKALALESSKHMVCYIIYALSLMLLYAASTLYHSAKEQEVRRKRNVWDHSAIYLLIAGSYTPFSLLGLGGTWGISILATVWGIAIIGIILKLFFIGQYSLVSTIGYVVMGCIVVVAIKPLIENMSTMAITYLVAGGISYIVGAVFYQIQKIPYNHAIFHFFVLGGSVFHFISIYLYL